MKLVNAGLDEKKRQAAINKKLKVEMEE